MKYLFILLLAFLVSCGDNHGGDDDIIIDTTPAPPVDTLGVDTVETIQAIGNRKGVGHEQVKSIVYYQVVKRNFKYKL